MKILLPVLLMALVPASAVWGAPAPKRTVQCRPLVVSGSVGEPWYVPQGKDAYRPVAVSGDFLGDPVAIEAGEKLRFYRKLAAPAKDASGKTVEYALAAEFDPAPNATRQLILLAEQGGKWFGRAYPDETGAFPNGTVMVFNFTKSAIGMDFGGSRLELKPNEHGVLAAPKKVENDAASIRALRMTAKGPVLFFNSSWPWSPDRRNLVFAYNVPGSDRVRFKGIDDVSAPEPVAPKSAAR